MSVGLKANVDGTSGAVQVNGNDVVTVNSAGNAKLAACDWTQLPDAPIDRQVWADYRQALRDITLQTDPFAIVWPQEP